MDHPGGVLIWFHIRDTDMLKAALRSLLIPSSDTACRIEFTLPGRPYKAELTKRKILPARTVSFSIKSAILANETSSCARLAIRRFRIGDKGGSCPKARRAFSRTVNGVAGAVTSPISAFLRKA